tara:strand:- start:1557 stop:3659 length:2103 start_codon:yes stop_codon:yes gene_type:complete
MRKTSYSDSNSSFWLDNDFFNDDQFDMLGEEIAKPKGKDPMKLAGYRRAIGNFVRIVTGEAIPVKFQSSGDSYTDGKSVVISASLKDKDFDPAVGLALHEGSHIKLTDFDTLRNLETWIYNHDSYMVSLSEKHGAKASELDGYDKWWTAEYVMPKLSSLINIIEDRRIDAWVYKNAPGYKGYYKALYEKYFNAKIIDKGLKSDEYTNADWDSFLFRICNLTNSNRRLDVLGLDEIWKLIDLKNIARLKDTNEVRDLAFEVFKFIENQIPSLELDKKKEGEGEGNGKGNGEDGEPVDSNGEPKTPEGDAESDDGSKAEGDEAKKGDGRNLGGVKAPNDLEELSDRQIDQLKRAIKKQEEFQNQDIKKTGVSKKLQRAITSMEDSGTEIKNVEYEQDNYWESGSTPKHEEVAVIKNFTKDLINNVECDMWCSSGTWGDYRIEKHSQWVNEGLRRGIVLGKKLKVRAEQKDTKFNRLRSGKIDKRRISSAGFGIENIFAKVESFAYNPGIIHISIDNSGSMNGERFQNAFTTSVAIAKACSMIDNMDCVISFRAGADFTGRTMPVILVAYDSRKHGMSQLKTNFPHVIVSGVTPEGLCFDAIMKEVLESSRGKDAYFVNMSDGMPYYGNYHGDSAHKHTKEQVKKMTREGIKVISYFITGSYGISESEEKAFNAMYGKEAQYINTKKINEVAKSMNKKFLELV